jgi:hypothetical protein
MCNQRHNGYANYETFAVAMWIDNDELFCTEITQMAEDAIEEGIESYHFAGQVKAYVENEILGESYPDSGLLADLFNAAWSEIDWYELAEYYLNSAKDNAECTSAQIDKEYEELCNA